MLSTRVEMNGFFRGNTQGTQKSADDRKIAQDDIKVAKGFLRIHHSSSQIVREYQLTAFTQNIPTKFQTLECRSDVSIADF